MTIDRPLHVLALAAALMACALAAPATAAAATSEHDHDDGTQTHGSRDPDDNHDGDHEADHEVDHEEEGHGDAVELTAAQVKQAQLAIATAGPGTIRQTLPVFGRIEAIPSRTAVVQARFPGQIISLTPDVGESVSRGAVIGMVEADDSLQRYALRAPISGVVVERMASPGEATAGRSLLRIADFGEVWAQLAIFPSQISRVSVGQALTVRGDDITADAQIDWIAPAADHGPARMARVVLPNPDGRWAPGNTVQAEIVTALIDAELVVETRAIQQVEGQPSVFVREGNRFEAHALTLGRSDGRVTEVLGGLAPGANYVTANSYLLKAELEKSSASHDH
ncbi:MAG: efflux RND transporter periplasmic adaptor subunit [Abyssibacter sp.]|nr:efflux RND transporter periplasmic adaptor subunit [Abyssibacter sp.]MCK5859354.1 efflux RND transporter periplasmic adaptor subunit [Abyssibacter sp.]